jgi:alkylresorcinol/alkylpyrone synthase
MTSILAVRSAFPAYRYPQAELTQKIAELSRLSPVQRTLLERLHRNAGVDTRHTALPLAAYGELDGVGPTNDRYIEEATTLGERALRAALDAAELDPADLDMLVVTSVTGVAVPSLDARLIPRLGLRSDVKRVPIFGLGCVAGAAGLARVHDYLLAWPRHTAAVLSVELCTLTWSPSAVTTADMVVNGLFGDGAAALVATGTHGKRRSPRVLATRSEVYPDSEEALGWRLGSEGFRIVLTAELSDVVDRRLGGSVTAFLAEHGLTIDDITNWICHPGGPRVIDAARDSLKLSDSDVALSRQSLAAVGNLSSASVLHVLELLGAEPQREGTFGMMIGLGPGVSAELVLLQWLSTGFCSVSSRSSGWRNSWCPSGTRRPVCGVAGWSPARGTSLSWSRCTWRCSSAASSSRSSRTARSSRRWRGR